MNLFYALLLSLCFVVSGAGQSSEKGLEGIWEGTLDAGGARLRLLLTVSKTPAGAYTGKLDSLDQGSTIPIDTITVNEDAVRLELKAVQGVFAGKLNKERTELVGSWTQGGGALPLTFRPQQAAARPPAPATRPLTMPLDLAVPVPPTAFQAGGKWHLVYELHVTNFGAADCALTRVEALGAGNDSLGRFDGAALTGLLARPGTPAVTEKARIGAGLRAVVYLWLTVDAEAAVPTALRHRLTVKVGDFPEELNLDGPRIPVRKGAIALSPPLRGDGWLAANGPSNASGHRRAMIPVDGQAHIAQRFAIDWAQLREEGGTHAGDPKNNKNYRCYGAEALAVSDAIVVAIKDGIPENIPGANSRAVPITLETIGGNHVILDLGQGRYGFYAHLQPGSLRVKVGDKVRRGQVLGLVGNSGNSTEPHLHFHVSDANSPLGSEGLPYALTEFEVMGSGWEWKPGNPLAPGDKRKLELPRENEVVRFPAKP